MLTSAGGHARPVDLDGVGVGAGRPAAGGQLIGDLVLVGGLDQPLDDLVDSCSGRDRSPARCPGARPPLPSSRSWGSRWRGSRPPRCPPADRSPKALVLAPRRPISSCTVETAYTPQASLLARHAPAEGLDHHPQPALSSIAGETARLLGIVRKPSSNVTAIADRAPPWQPLPCWPRRCRATSPSSSAPASALLR